MKKQQKPSDNQAGTNNNNYRLEQEQESREPQFAVWPDGTSCHVDELEQMLIFMSDDFRLEHDDPNEDPNEHCEACGSWIGHHKPVKIKNVNTVPDEHRQWVISKYYKCLEPVFGGGYMFSPVGAWSISAEDLRIIADYIDEKEEQEQEPDPCHLAPEEQEIVDNCH